MYVFQCVTSYTIFINLYVPVFAYLNFNECDLCCRSKHEVITQLIFIFKTNFCSLIVEFPLKAKTSLGHGNITNHL
jgi:hypothetical protein